jgi:catechol 2,3-dioxygenase-like lactoylglutathione lyase family enzyme
MASHQVLHARMTPLLRAPLVELTSGIAVRIARPTRDLVATAAFYRDLLGLPVLGSFEDHDGFSGLILGIPDASRQLELVAAPETEPAPTAEDPLVLYLGSPERVAAAAARIRAAGHGTSVSPNPYWARLGAACFVDPDGYWLVLSPQSWTGDR